MSEIEPYFSVPKSTLDEVISLICKIIFNEVEYNEDQLEMAKQALRNSRAFANQAERKLSKIYLPPNTKERDRTSGVEPDGPSCIPMPRSQIDVLDNPPSAQARS